MHVNFILYTKIKLYKSGCGILLCDPFEKSVGLDPVVSKTFISK